MDLGIGISDLGFDGQRVRNSECGVVVSNEREAWRSFSERGDPLLQKVWPLGPLV